MIKLIETVLYIIAVSLMALNFLFDLPNVGKAGYVVLFISFIVSVVTKSMYGKKKK